MPKFDLKKHQELWNWLADNPGSLKEEWPGWVEIEDWDNEIYPDNNCFACEYMKLKLMEEGRTHYDILPETCSVHCPLLWPEGRTCCERYNSLFREWDNANDKRDYETASNLARQIAELPVREGVETI